MLLIATLLLIALLIAVERAWPARAEPSPRLHNLQAWLALVLVQVLVLPGVTLAVAAQHVSLVDLAGWPFVLALLAYTIVQDIGEFAFHRAQHAIPWLWRMHSLHHSDPNMNATTAVRHFWGDQLIKAVTIWPAAALLLRPTPAIVAAYAAIGLIHFFIHSNLPVNLGRWSWLINSPAYHRRHHSREAAHYNCNFASIFPIFDLICGSYRRPDGFPETGLEQQPRGLADIALWPWRA